MLGGLLVALVLVLGALYLYDRGQSDVISKGISVAGVPVGGLHASAARARIEARVIAPLTRPLTVVSANRHWELTAQQARLRVNVTNTVDAAMRLSREGSFISRALRALEGKSLDRNVALAVSYDHSAVRRLDDGVRRMVNLAPRDATVQPSGGALQEVASRSGVKVNSRLLAVDVERALTGGGPRRVVVPTVAVAPKVTTAHLASAYPAYIIVDRASYTLRFYRRLRLTHSYPIAVGMQGLETPPGLYHIQWKQVNPPWYVPNSAWAGALAGQTIPPGPQDPLKARFMSFDGGAGIHGIDPSEYGSIGHNASHGCVRMTIPDVIDLYGRSPVGTPVYVV